MKVIASFQRLHKDTADMLMERADGWQWVQLGDSPFSSQLCKAEIIIGWNDNLMREFPYPASKLRWVQHWGSGIDGLPLERLAAHQVLLTTTKGIHVHPMSETAFAMMLGLTRKIRYPLAPDKALKWNEGAELGELHGKCIGLLGAGAVGEEIARLAKAFSMKVYGMNRSLRKGPSLDEVFAPHQVQELLHACDYVVNLLPLTKETYHFIGQEQFEAMRPTAYYINLGRGATNNLQALTEALLNGTIQGAGLDVFEGGKLEDDHPLWEMENVIITPYNAGLSSQYERRAIDIFLHNFSDYENGITPSLNLVNYAKGG